MKKQILLITFLVLAVMLSVSAISANDVNVTGSYATNLVDDSSDDSVLTSYEIDSSEGSASNDENVVSDIVGDSSKVSLSSEEVLESDNSNDLSTNNLGSSLDSDSVLESSKSTSLSVSNTNIYYKTGDKLKVTLMDSNNNGISGQKVSITIVGKTYTVTTDKDGIGYLAIGLNPGTYPITVAFGGTAQYDAAKSISANVNVLGTIKSNDVVKYYKGSAKYTATFLTNQGAALSNTTVKVTVVGKTYNVKTNENGVASLALNLKPGTYKIVSEDPITGYKVTNTVKVLSTVSSSDLSKVYTDSKKFTAKFYNNEGKALANTKVNFVFVTGKSSKTYAVKTDNSGVASLAIGASPGTYTIKSVNPDGITNTNTIKVYRIVNSKLITQSYMFVPGDSRKVQVTLHNVFDYAPGAGKVVSLTINGKTYTGTSNSNGVVSFNLPTSIGRGIYTATYKFDGNSFYRPSSASNKVIILDTKDTHLTIKSSSTFGYGASTPFKAFLHANGIPLAGRKVAITVTGKTYTRTTDANGIASLPINLNKGKFDISYSFAGETKLKSCSGKTTITVAERTTTSLTWKTGTTLSQGSQTHKILLLDSNNKGVGSKKVTLTVNKVTYSATTGTDGYAKFTVNLPAGTYAASYSFEGDNSYKPSTGTTNLVINKKTSYAGGYWLFGGDMKNVNLATLASKGTSDIFLNYYAITLHGKSAVETWIASANKNGIRVHIWMQTLYKDGKWINPKTASAATLNSIVNEATDYAKVKGISGVHLDYLRYPGTAYNTNGGTSSISSLVQRISTSVHSANPNCIVSAAVMPETTQDAYYYGQDIPTLSKYVDVLVPMIYKGNYKSGTSWISTTTKWFVDNSKGAQIWAGLQGFKSDDDTTKLSTSEITTDSQAAVNAKASGVIIFRWGLTNFVDFTGSTGGSSVSVSINSIISGAKTVKSYYEANDKLPTSVKLAEGTFTMPEFLYLMSKAIVNLGSSNTNAIKSISGVKNPGSATTEFINSQQLSKTDYITLASRVATYITNNKQAPAYATSTVGNIVYTELVDSFSRVIAFYSNNDKYMPNYVTIKQGTASSSYPSSITALAKQLTNGLTSDTAKATALYNWVRDNIGYSFYYNTQKGASGTLTSRSGNCCDQAQLLVALARSSGLTARFATGYCTFSSGSYGHVWVQIKISGSWHAVDTTSPRNTFNKINNWNTASYTNRGTYDVLPY